jgi:uncharacterized protein YbcC (UPF0753/DUF2309 family)
MSGLSNGIQHFDLSHTIEELKHYLPSQTPLKDFVHHNSLHAFQNNDFFTGIFKARDAFGYNVTLNISEFRNLYQDKRIRKEILDRCIVEKKGLGLLDDWREKLLHQEYTPTHKSKIGLLRNKWKTAYKLNLDNKVQPILFRIVCSYLDQGIAIDNFPHLQTGFFTSLQAFEKNSYSSFFKSKRAKALLNNPDITVESLLDIVVGNPEIYQQYIFDQQFSHRGWSGMVATLEQSNSSLLDKKIISLIDFIKVELLLEIDILDQQFGTNWQPLSTCYESQEIFQLLEPYVSNEYDEILTIWQEAFEWSYYDEVLFALQKNYTGKEELKVDKSFQAIFCIDERECSLRRHVEFIDNKAETFGAPGFFGVEFYFQPQNGKFFEKLCPAPVTPKYLILESANNTPKEHSFLYHKIAHSLIGGWFFNLSAGFYSAYELIRNIFSPKMTPGISNAFLHVGEASDLSIEHKGHFDSKSNLQIGFTVQEMTDRVKAQLLNMGLIHNFAPIIYMVAHGSSSANNPHHGAHDCGACSGRPGSVNARVFSFMANHPIVRKSLLDQGIAIPNTTQFIGGLHDTAADQIAFFDTSILTASNAVLHQQNLQTFEAALDLNAKERSRRFASIDTKSTLKEVRNEIKKRAVSLFEPRPELGHGSNALCIIGRRNVSKSVFLDRRAFLNSYDYHIDPDGVLLKNVISPIGPVCGGINLEYYFSRIDNLKLGAGTKLPHNVMGLIGVANSIDGDLRPGLPLQMIEVHDPIRLLVVVEQNPNIVKKVLDENKAIKDWYIKNWIHLVVMNPTDQKLYVYKAGNFEVYAPISLGVQTMDHLETVIENATEMSEFTIENATKENLPIYLINKK